MTRKTLAAAISSAYLAGVGTGGSGVLPQLIVEGDAPAEADGWKCEAEGPMLDAKLVCRFVPTTPASPPVLPPVDCGWQESTTPDGTVVMKPTTDCAGALP